MCSFHAAFHASGVPPLALAWSRRRCSAVVEHRQPNGIPDVAHGTDAAVYVLGLIRKRIEAQLDRARQTGSRFALALTAAAAFARVALGSVIGLPTLEYQTTAEIRALSVCPPPP